MIRPKPQIDDFLGMLTKKPVSIDDTGFFLFYSEVNVIFCDVYK